MGYTIFTGDNGTYMHMPGVDAAIAALAYREHIPTTDIHACSAYTLMEYPMSLLTNTEESLVTSFQAFQKAYEEIQENALPMENDLVYRIYFSQLVAGIQMNQDQIQKNLNIWIKITSFLNTYPQFKPYFYPILSTPQFLLSHQDVKEY